MKELELTQGLFAEKLGVSRQTVAAILSRGKLPKDKYLSLIAEILQVSEEYLLQDSKPGYLSPEPASDTGKGDLDVYILRLETENRMLREENERLRELIRKIKQKPE
ncbi:helix-turn-helix transcriptional regulator [Larkinella soli]|uniref:helix-turn-helix transcriptional regulator n=1 Tax=Larkinella soli TaxID=1770527 RepID=UPI0013E2E73B|nr:helix-turn-helix transcriptional regulator [Larkinella soli]